MLKDEVFLLSTWRKRGCPIGFIHAPLQISSIVWDEAQQKWVAHHYTEDEMKALKEKETKDEHE